MWVFVFSWFGFSVHPIFLALTAHMQLFYCVRPRVKKRKGPKPWIHHHSNEMSICVELMALFLTVRNGWTINMGYCSCQLTLQAHVVGWSIKPMMMLFLYSFVPLNALWARWCICNYVPNRPCVLCFIHRCWLEDCTIALITWLMNDCVFVYFDLFPLWRWNALFFSFHPV